MALEKTKRELELERVLQEAWSYIDHTCTYHQTDSPRDDVCTCNVGSLRKRIKILLDQ